MDVSETLSIHRYIPGIWVRTATWWYLAGLYTRYSILHSELKVENRSGPRFELSEAKNNPNPDTVVRVRAVDVRGLRHGITTAPVAEDVLCFTPPQLDYFS